MFEMRSAGRRSGLALTTPLALGLLAVLVLPALAQQPSQGAAQPPADPVFAAAQAAFDALPEADRKAIQEQLIWTGDFSGAGTGGFGPLTYRGIQAFQKRAGAKADGILQPKERAALDRAAAQAREAVRFTVVLDARSGSRIGLPQKLMDRTRQSPEGTVFAAADGSATLEMLAPQGAELQPLYDLLRADGPKRRVTYKVLRPDWFVVAGEAEGRRFYTRMTQTPAGLRGYTLSYAASRAAEFDRIAIAVANSFDAAPGRAAATAGGSPAAPGSSTQAQPQGTSQPRPIDVPGHFSGLLAGGGTVVTVAAVDRCKALTIGRQPARIQSVDGATGSPCSKWQVRRRPPARSGAQSRPTRTRSWCWSRRASADRRSLPSCPARRGCRRQASRASSRRCRRGPRARRYSTGRVHSSGSSASCRRSRAWSPASCPRPAGPSCQPPPCSPPPRSSRRGEPAGRGSPPARSRTPSGDGSSRSSASDEAAAQPEKTTVRLPLRITRSSR